MKILKQNTLFYFSVWRSFKSLGILGLSKDVRKLIRSYSVGRNVNWYHFSSQHFDSMHYSELAYSLN